eukprot:1998695-Pyramimonas_sp.AAC.1
MFRVCLGLELAADVASTLASSQSVAARLVKTLARYCPSLACISAAPLGCDLAPGQGRARKGRRSRMQARFRDMRTRHGFLRCFGRAASQG